jgi:hypothetical protein
MYETIFWNPVPVMGKQGGGNCCVRVNKREKEGVIESVGQHNFF